MSTGGPLDLDLDAIASTIEILNKSLDAIPRDGDHVPETPAGLTSGSESSALSDIGISDSDSVLSSAPPNEDNVRTRSRATRRGPRTIEDSDEEESSDGKGSFNEDESAIHYEVDTILDKKTSATGRITYLVKWKPVSPNKSSDETWEPLNNLKTCKDLVKKFEGQLRKAPTNSRKAQRRKRRAVDGDEQTSDASDSEEFRVSSTGEPSATDTDGSDFEASPRSRSKSRKKLKKRKVEKTVPRKSKSHHSTCGHCHFGDMSAKRGKKRKNAQSSDDGVVRENLQKCQYCAAAYHPSCSKRKPGEERLNGENDKFVCLHCQRHSPTCLLCGDPPSADKDSDDESAVIPLFRCDRCSVTTHDGCLLRLIAENDDLDEDDSIEGMRKRWRCPDCVRWDRNIECILTYRDIPVEKENEPRILYLQPKASERQNGEAAWASGFRREYLLKLDGLSYREVVWVPSRWLSKVAKPKLLTFWRERPKPQTVQEVVPKAYTRMDEILDIRNIEGELNEDAEINVNAIEEVYCKWKKLPYTSATWSSPPDADDSSNEDFVSALDSYRNRLKVGVPPKQQRKHRQQFVELTEQPECMQNGSLYNHQLEGLNWLLYRYYKSEGCILADDMGLGKTIQIIGLFATIFKKHGSFPFLIVVPNSTAQNWRREFRKWAPQLVTVCHSGLGKEKEIVRDYLLFNKKNITCHVVIATYETATTELATLKRAGRYEILVVDEGQRLKSDSSKLFRKLGELNVGHKILLTGTPLQNNLREIFNLMNFLDAENFPDTEALEKKYSVLDGDAVSEIQNMLKPYILRRTKQEVLKDFPNLVEIIVPVGMSPLQKTIYKSVLQKNITVLQAISNVKPGVNKGAYRSLHNSLMEVRKCLNHPYLVVPEQRHVSDEAIQQNRMTNCAKFQFLHDLLPKLKAAGNRVLIFSQMVILLNELEDFIYDEGYKYVRFDGTTPQQTRQERIDAFNAEGSELFIFLISTRAGGVGINLASADTVIIYDVDFNPHQDLQAISRAHRIGQNKKILVLKLMTKNSAEERIMQIGKKKLILDHLIIETMNRKEDDEPVDVASILKYGAQALFAEDGDPAAAEKTIKYTSAEIDAILARRDDPKTVANAENSVGGFGFARIWLNDNAVELPVEDAKAEADAKYWDALAERLAKEESKQLKLGRGARKRNRLNYSEQIDNSPKKNDLPSQELPDYDLEVDVDFIPPAEVDSSSESTDDTATDGELLLMREEKRPRLFSPDSASMNSMQPLDNATITPTPGLSNGLSTSAKMLHQQINPQARSSAKKRVREKGRGKATPPVPGARDLSPIPIFGAYSDNYGWRCIPGQNDHNPTISATHSPVIPQMLHSHMDGDGKNRTQNVNGVPNIPILGRYPTVHNSSNLPSYTGAYNGPSLPHMAATATGVYSAAGNPAYVASAASSRANASGHPLGMQSYPNYGAGTPQSAQKVAANEIFLGLAPGPATSSGNGVMPPPSTVNVPEGANEYQGIERTVDPSLLTLNHSARKADSTNSTFPSAGLPQRTGLPNYTSPISTDALPRTTNGGSAVLPDTPANSTHVQGNFEPLRVASPSTSTLAGMTTGTFKPAQLTGLSKSSTSASTSMPAGGRSSIGGTKGRLDQPASSAHSQRNNGPSPSHVTTKPPASDKAGNTPGVSPAQRAKLSNLSSSVSTDTPPSSARTTNDGSTGALNMAANTNRSASVEQLACFNCKVTESRVWRTGFGQRRRLCNECGLYYAKIGHHRRVTVCWCCCKQHTGECSDMTSVLKLLERKAAINNDKTLDERQKRELSINVDKALRNATAGSATLLPVRDHRTNTRYEAPSSYSSSPLFPATVPGEFRSKGRVSMPSRGSPQHRPSQPNPAHSTLPKSQKATGTLAAPIPQPNPTLPARSSAALSYTYTGCVICRSPVHNLGSCPSRLDPEIVRSQHAKILADDTIPLAKRAELASGLALYMNNRVLMKTKRPFN